MDDRTVLGDYSESPTDRIKRIAKMFCDIIGVDAEQALANKQIIIIKPEMKKPGAFYSGIASKKIAFHILDGKGREQELEDGTIMSIGGSMELSVPAMRATLGHNAGRSFDRLQIRAEVAARLFTELTGLNGSALSHRIAMKDGSRVVWVDEASLEKAEQNFRAVKERQAIKATPIQTSVVFASAVQKLIHESTNPTLRTIKLRCENPLTFPQWGMYHFPDLASRQFIEEALKASKLTISTTDISSITVETPATVEERQAALEALKTHLNRDQRIQAAPPAPPKPKLFNRNDPRLDFIGDSKAQEPVGEVIAEILRRRERALERIGEELEQERKDRPPGGR